MIAIDSNVLVRYIAQDDSEQSERASRLFESELTEQSPGFVPLLALAELFWVLRRKYGAPPDRITQLVKELLLAPNIVVEQAELVQTAVAEQVGDFPDRLIHLAGKAVGCDRTVTFDRRFARLPGVELLKS